MEFSQLQEIFHEIQTFMSQVMQIRTEPTETLQALGLLEHNYEALKNMLMISDYKKELERAELNDLTNLTSDLDKLEVNFDVTYLMICAMFGYEEKGKELLLRGASVNQQNRQGLTALMFASMFQFDEFVRMLLENGADVNLKDNRQMDALMWAVLQGHDDITQILLDHGADVLSKTPSRLDALHISVEKGFTSIVEMLLERNVCVSSKSLDGWTPLMRSARLQDSKIAKLLLQRNLNVNETTFQGITALHISVMYQNLKCIRRLLKRGANINCKDIMGLTPLMYAAGFDNVQVICTLFENGATKSINDVNNTNQSALFRAVIGNVENIVHLLISAGATTNIFDINDFSPIIYASYNQRPSIVEQLLKHKDSAWHKSNEFETCLRLAVSKNDVGTTKCLLNVQNVEQILSDRKKFNTTILSVAVMNGNKDMAKLLLGAGADVNAVNGLLQSVLFTSIAQKDVDMATLLVQKYGADVNLKDFRGDTPLILAASSNNKPMVDLLLRKKASRQEFNMQGVSALMEAASFGNYDIIRALHVKSYDLEFSDNNGWTPLMFASFSGDCFAVEFLLEKGANIDAFSNLGATSLIIASDHGKESVVSLLLKSGANVNAKSIHGMTALCYSARKGHTRISELLIESGADVNHEDYLKKTALMYAVLLKDLESVKLLIKHHANYRQSDTNGATLLMVASSSGFTECVKFLLDLKVPMDETNVDGNTALHFCTSFRHIESLSMLLQNKANPSITNANGDTPIMLASAKGYEEIVNALLSCPGFKINQCNSNDGRSSLMIASQFNQVSIVQLLLKAGANVNAKSKLGDTALHLSIANGCIEVIKILHTYQGIDLSAENDAGFTPLFQCIARQRYEILKMLCDSGIDAKKNNKNGDNAITFSIKHHSLEALQIILQKCQLFSKEKNDYIALARRLSAGHIASFLQQYEPTENTAAENIHSSQCLQLPTNNQALPEDVSTTNTSVSFAEDQRCMSGSTDNQTTSSDPPCPAIDKSFNLEIDSSKDKPLCFNLNGDCRGATINANIFYDRTKNCIVGKQNSLTDQKTVKE